MEVFGLSFFEEILSWRVWTQRSLEWIGLRMAGQPLVEWWAGRGFWMPGLLFLGCPGLFGGVVLVLVCFSGVAVFGAEVGAFLGVFGVRLQSTGGLEIHNAYCTYHCNDVCTN
jgi:hypothetical protein